ncbi:MAG: non-homologous end-joining DNA ligase [Simkaniaceae bacterium]|nr:non-homologous end-joining DNA ligase [Simkaniaceae bacterium]
MIELEKGPQPHWIKPMLATLVNEPFSDKDWIFERKLDGERCLIFKKGKKISIYSRNHKKLNAIYPELVIAFAKQPMKNMIIDGEIVTFEGKKISFTKLQSRIHLKNQKSPVPIYFYAFDILYYHESDTRQLPQIQRKALLKKALHFTHRIRYTTHVKTKGIESSKKACKNGWEGIIAKKADSPYLSKRSRNWLKFKCTQQGEFIICGYTAPQGKRIGFGSLLIGYYKNNILHYAGRVGTGYDTKLLTSLSKRLQTIERRTAPFKEQKIALKGVHFVQPKIKCNITFTEWTNNKRLRHPRFSGLSYKKG